MIRGRPCDKFIACLDAFSPVGHAATRSLALYSAAIALSDSESLRKAQQVCKNHGATVEQMYETVLQSYLFLGFPRMLTAAERLAEDGLTPLNRRASLTVDEGTVADWLVRGRTLCRRVYDSNYHALKSRVEAMAPEIFLWMELEGYGKILSRPGLDIVDRELAIVSCLIMENRPAQLHSHLRGAINVGAPHELIRDVVSDITPVVVEADEATVGILRRLELV